jgi:hypothetical protein
LHHLRIEAGAMGDICDNMNRGVTGGKDQFAQATICFSNITWSYDGYIFDKYNPAWIEPSDFPKHVCYS